MSDKKPSERIGELMLDLNINAPAGQQVAGIVYRIANILDEQHDRISKLEGKNNN